MISIRRILCPVDFSESSTHAIEYALAFASAYRAELRLLHVVYPPSYGVGADGINIDITVQMTEHVEKTSREQLHALAENARTSWPEVTEEILTGVPFLEIIRSARAAQADLIVMGTHGRTGLAHALIGSVAERVVRKAPCPVLTVKHPEHDFVMP
jgi:nucleotide-binding universal stress UspA family protein